MLGPLAVTSIVGTSSEDNAIADPVGVPNPAGAPVAPVLPLGMVNAKLNTFAVFGD